MNYIVLHLIFLKFYLVSDAFRRLVHDEFGRHDVLLDGVLVGDVLLDGVLVGDVLLDGVLVGDVLLLDSVLVVLDGVMVEPLL